MNRITSIAIAEACTKTILEEGLLAIEISFEILSYIVLSLISSQETSS